MKRDMDLVRDLFLKIEEAPEPTSSHALSSGHDDEEARRITDHLRLLHDAGFITCIASNPISGRWSCQHIKLTWAGHDFLATVRDPEVWKETKSRAAQIGGYTLDIIKELAKGYLKQKAQQLGFG